MRQTLLYIVSLIFTKFILTFYCENNGVGKAYSYKAFSYGCRILSQMGIGEFNQI